MRTWKQAEEAGRAVGFKLLESRDVALASPAAVKPWCAAGAAVGAAHGGTRTPAVWFGSCNP